MANIKSQKKRNKQNEKRRLKNAKIKTSIRTLTKKVNGMVESSESTDTASLQEKFKRFVKVIDSSVQKGILKKETGARKKSRMAKKVNEAIKQSA